MGERLFFSKLITKDLTAVDSSRRLFEGVLTVEMKDRQGEITIRDELLKVLPIWIARGGPITDTHSNRVVGKGINFSSTTVTDASGNSFPAITIQGEIFRDYQLDDEIWKAIKSGKYKGLSFGGATKTGRTPILQKDGSVAYSLKDLEQYEVAVCEEPAVPLALITQHNEIAKAMAGNTSDRGDGKMCIRCDKFKCYVEKNGEPYADVTGKNEPEKRDDQAESFAEKIIEREHEIKDEKPSKEEEKVHEKVIEELENNRGEPQENGATYHGTNKADDEILDPEREGVGTKGKNKIPGIKEKTPGNVAGKMEYSQITTEKLASRTHTCDMDVKETKHITVDGSDPVGQNLGTCKPMGTNVIKENGMANTGDAGSVEANHGGANKKTMVRIRREFEDEGHGDPFDEKSMDKDDKEMLERAGLEEETKEPEKHEGKNEVIDGEEHTKEGKNYDREIHPGMPGNDPEEVNKIAPLLAAAGSTIARGAVSAGRAASRAAKDTAVDVAASTMNTEPADDPDLTKSMDMLRLAFEVKKKRAKRLGVKVFDKKTGKWEYATGMHGGKGRKRMEGEHRSSFYEDVRGDKKHSRSVPPGKAPTPRRGGVGQQTITRKLQKPGVAESNKRRAISHMEEISDNELKESKINTAMRNMFKEDKSLSTALDMLGLAFAFKTNTCGNTYTEPARGGFAGREPGVTKEDESKSHHDVANPKNQQTVVDDQADAHKEDEEDKKKASKVGIDTRNSKQQPHRNASDDEVSHTWYSGDDPKRAIPPSRISGTVGSYPVPGKKDKIRSEFSQHMEDRLPKTDVINADTGDVIDEVDSEGHPGFHHERSISPNVARRLKMDNAMAAVNSENGKKDEVATNHCGPSEAFKGEKTTTIKEKRPTQVIHHLATNKFDTTTRPMGSDGVRGNGAYNTAMQSTGTRDVRVVKQEKCKDCGEDASTGADNAKYNH